MADEEQKAVIDAREDGIVSVEFSSDCIYDDIPEKVREYDDIGLIDIADTDGCRLVVTDVDPENSFTDSEYVEYMSRLTMLLGEMFDVDPTDIAGEVLDEVARKQISEIMGSRDSSKSD
jgi:hypothetical protein